MWHWQPLTYIQQLVRHVCQTEVCSLLFFIISDVYLLFLIKPLKYIIKLSLNLFSCTFESDEKTFWNCLFYEIHIAAGLEYGIWGESYSYGYVKFCMIAHLLRLQWRIILILKKICWWILFFFSLWKLQLVIIKYEI